MNSLLTLTSDNLIPLHLNINLQCSEFFKFFIQASKNDKDKNLLKYYAKTIVFDLAYFRGTGVTRQETTILRDYLLVVILFSAFYSTCRVSLRPKIQCGIMIFGMRTEKCIICNIIIYSEMSTIITMHYEVVQDQGHEDVVITATFLLPFHFPTT